MTLATARLLIGRTIVGLEMNPFNSEHDGKGKGPLAYNPELILDNGARITLTVQETESGEYGVRPNYHPAPRRGG